MKKYTEPTIKASEFARENITTLSGGILNVENAKNEMKTDNVKIVSYSDIF